MTSRARVAVIIKVSMELPVGVKADAALAFVRTAIDAQVAHELHHGPDQLQPGMKNLDLSSLRVSLMEKRTTYGG